MDIREIGVKENRIKLLESKGLGTVEEVQRFFPRKYYDFSVQRQLDVIYADTYCAIIGRAEEITTKKTNEVLMVKAKVYDEITGRKLNVMWIGAYYIYKIIREWEGERVIVCGKLTYSEEYHSFHMNNPIIFDRNIEKNLKVYPVYKKMAKISEDYMSDLIKKALEIQVEDQIPAELVKKHRLMTTGEAVGTLHNPSSMQDLGRARQRIVYDKMIEFAVEMEKTERSVSKGTIYNIKTLKNTMDYIEKLPYKLTPSQNEVFRQMSEKAKNGLRVNALIQGDVGSGKTTSAFLMMFAMADSGYQSLIMAPTVILATQHYENLKVAADRYGYKVAFLAGKQTAKEKKSIIEQIESGECQFIVGTHSVISEGINYKNLALAIIDEEHKFGVKQRKVLEDRAKYGVHCISMSATPIPRTIVSIAYGNGTDVYDLEVPASRKPVQTAVCASNDSIFKFLQKKLDEGQQAYVVCPFIEDPEEQYNVETVEATFKAYSDKFNTFGDINVGCVTGKMKVEDVDETIRKFAAGEIKILVSTTVIEVGVNVPNSNVIVINNAERFGLAQLHQLRGRVGRGSDQGYCILKSAEKENPRLGIMCSTTNGYEIAEEDMRLRGTGEILGTAQSGRSEIIDLITSYPKMYGVVKRDASMLVDAGY